MPSAMRFAMPSHSLSDAAPADPALGLHRISSGLFRTVAAVAAATLIGTAAGGVAGAHAASAASAPPATAAASARLAAALASDVRSASWSDSAGTRSTYHLFTSGVAAGKVSGLVVYLDGDGMYGHDNPTSTWALGGSNGVVAKAAARGYATLSIRTPDTSGTPTFWENGKVNAAYVAALTRKVSADLGTNHVWLVGYSGGSQLITKFLLPAHAAQFTSGGAVITGGGGAPSSSSATFDKAMQQRFPLHWYTGSADNGRTSSDGYDALSDAKRGVAWYAARGFVTSRAEPAGVDHSGLGTRFGGVLAEQIAKYPAPGVGTTPLPLPTPAPAPNPVPIPVPPTNPAPVISAWTALATAARTTVRVVVDVPQSARGRVTLTVKDSAGRTRSQVSTRTYGSDVRLVAGGLRARTAYTYTVTHDGGTRASGTFTTTR